MKLYRAARKNVIDEEPQPSVVEVPLEVPHVQKAPVALPVEDGKEAGRIKVDLVGRIGSKIVVAGWVTAELDLVLEAEQEPLQAIYTKTARPDVAAHLALSNPEVGFVLTASYATDAPVALSWYCPHRKEQQSFVLDMIPDFILNKDVVSTIAPALPALLTDVPAFSADWERMISLLSPHAVGTSEAKGYIEQAIACERSGEGIVIGWVLQKNEGAPVWIENEDGAISPLGGEYRTYRQDVIDAFGSQFGTVEDAGLLAYVQGMKPGKKIKMKTLTEEGVHVLAETTVGVLPTDPVAAARRLFSINVVQSEFNNRIAVIDEPIISTLLQLRQVTHDTLPRKVRQLGIAPQKPLVSIIIPLYGRIDFVEHQLMEFCEDKWLIQNAELIYVLDDPALVEQFSGRIEALYRVYQTPIRWVWGGANRGFSGANNLGVECAKGEYLTFLNSDAFPQATGWLESLVDVLRANPQVGAVGPRLVTAEGSIQHAGMEFHRRSDLGIWINHHPNMGLDPALDPVKTLTMVPAVTGACMMMRRCDFDAVGGWDTGYLIGDFEDSDLCLKLRSAGFKIAYCPTVQLTHLERQSFKLLGNDEFRSRVVVYNAVRHQNKWGTLLESENRISGV